MALINYFTPQQGQIPVGQYYTLRSHTLMQKHQSVNTAKRRRLMLAMTLSLPFRRCLIFGKVPNLVIFLWT